MGQKSIYELGEDGVINETGTTKVDAPEGKYFAALQILDDANFSALTDAGATDDVITGITILARQILFGRFSTFTLTSGKVRAYLRRDKNA